MFKTHHRSDPFTNMNDGERKQVILLATAGSDHLIEVYRYLRTHSASAFMLATVLGTHITEAARALTLLSELGFVTAIEGEPQLYFQTSEQRERNIDVVCLYLEALKFSAIDLIKHGHAFSTS